MGMIAYFKILQPSELQTLIANPDDFDEVLFPFDCDDPFKDQTSLEKEWHGLHYVLCGKLQADGTALGDAVLGGRPIGPDLGYGQGRLVDLDRVKEINSALLSVDFAERYDKIDRTNEDIKQLYTHFEFDDSERAYHIRLLHRLSQMYAHAAEKNYSVFTYFA